MNSKKQNLCFKQFHNIHEGETIFIIGNGPSLSETDLSLIEKFPSIAMNRISLLYSKYKNWRPKYYIFCSTNIFNPIWGMEWSKSVREAIEEPKTKSFIDERSFSYLFKGNISKSRNIHIMKNLTENKPNKEGDINSKSFSTNILNSIDKSGSTINVALQIAYFMGAARIIFLGTDLGWTANNGKRKDQNHFDKSYRAHIPDPIKANRQMRNVHLLAKKTFNKNKPNVDLYNASKYSKLDIYPFIDFEEFARNGKIIIDLEKSKLAETFWKNIKTGNRYLIKFRRLIYRIKEKIARIKFSK